ncbi:amidohydrolase family protein, partial [Streptomyces sp. NPDC048425]
MKYPIAHEAARTPLRIHNARLVDGTGASPVDDAVVLVDAEGIITYAGPAAEVPETAVRNTDPQVRTVDAGGRTLLPGFFDCHVHMSYAHGAHPGRRGE